MTAMTNAAQLSTEVQTKMNENKQSKMAVECASLTFLYGAITTLQDIDFSLPKGAVLGLVGANGSGKSTLLRCLVGLLEPSAGEARLLGYPALSMNDDLRARLGFVAQSPDLFEWMTVEAHLETIGKAYSTWNAQWAIELALMLRLPLLKEVKNLSGGDQQKLAVVLALAHQPDVIILDEPVSSLDPMTRRDFMRSLFIDKNLKQENADELSETTPSIIISSHLLSDLERVVTHIAFMRKGRLQLFATWDDVLEHIRLVHTADVMKTEINNVVINPEAIIYQSKQTIVVDTRKLSPSVKLQLPLNALNLDDLFIALNS